VTAWVGDEAARRRRDLELQNQLVGHRIKGVRYIELRYEGHPGPMWGGASFDSLDYGLELDLDNGTTWSVIWMQHGPNEALLVDEGPLAPIHLRADAATAVWDVTERWDALGPGSISRITSVWTRHGFGPAYDSSGQQVAPAGKSDMCLLTLLLRGPDGRETAITLGEDIDGGYAYTADNVSVFFSIDEARQARVLLPGDADAIA
jgi:hypothetical protein